MADADPCDETLSGSAGGGALILPGPPAFTPRTYGHKGQVYDGWETRRRRGPDGTLPADGEHDWVIVRLGAAGVVRAVVVDTAYFAGNYPQSCSVEGAGPRCCLTPRTGSGSRRPARSPMSGWMCSRTAG